MIYFVQPAEGGRIKIGTTKRLAVRLTELAREINQNLRVIAVIDGSYAEENELHQRFSHLRIVNEWFEPGDDLLGFIVQEGRQWSRDDDDNGLVAVKIPRDVYVNAKLISTFTGEEMAQIMGNILRAPLEKRAEEVFRASRHDPSEKPKPPKPKR